LLGLDPEYPDENEGNHIVNDVFNCALRLRQTVAAAYGGKVYFRIPHDKNKNVTGPLTLA
jgi:hypothetical protein